VIRAALLLAILLGACAGPAPAIWVPDWSGPAVHARHLGDRGLEVELVAPTGGHSFDLCLVERPAGAVFVDLHFVHHTPGDTFQAQVVTPLRVTVDGTRLGDARAVFVWIATAEPGVEPSPEKLAMALARP